MMLVAVKTEEIGDRKLSFIFFWVYFTNNFTDYPCTHAPKYCGKSMILLHRSDNIVHYYRHQSLLMGISANFFFSFLFSRESRTICPGPYGPGPLGPYGPGPLIILKNILSLIWSRTIFEKHRPTAPGA